MEQSIASVSKMKKLHPKEKGEGLWAGMLLLNSGENMGFLLVCFNLKVSKSCISQFQKKDFIYTRILML